MGRILGRGRAKAEPDPTEVERITKMLDSFLADDDQGGRRLNKGLYKHLPTMLDPGETLVDAALAVFGDSIWRKHRTTERKSQKSEMGYVALTDRRILGVASGLIGLGSRGGIDIPIAHILSVDNTRTIGQGIAGLGAPLRLSTGAGEVAFRVSPTRACDRMADAIRRQMNQNALRTTAATPAERIKELLVLLDEGLIGHEEYARRRDEILSSI